jgi:hypothetical protein
MRCLEKKPEQRYQTMSELEADLVRIEVGHRPAGPDTVTLTPTKPARAGRARVSPIYLGGLGAAFLALAGALAMSVWLERGADQSAANSRQLPPPPGASSTTDPVDPGTAPPDRDSKEAFASADEAPPLQSKARRAKPVRRKPKPRGEQPQRHDTAILDPWE